MANRAFSNELVGASGHVAKAAVCVEGRVLVLQELSAIIIEWDKGIIYCDTYMDLIINRWEHSLVDKGADLGDMQLGGGAIEKCLCIGNIEDCDCYVHFKGRFLEQVVEEGGIVHGQLLKYAGRKDDFDYSDDCGCVRIRGRSTKSIRKLILTLSIICCRGLITNRA